MIVASGLILGRVKLQDYTYQTEHFQIDIDSSVPISNESNKYLSNCHILPFLLPLPLRAVKREIQAV